ncbi:MAG: ATP-binding protein, partial [Hyphomicrobiaceae bacterium]
MSGDAYTLKPWSDVVEPHEDVRTGELAMGTYAANLAAVAFGDDDGPEVYADAERFFASTYFTEAMQGILRDVSSSLAGEPGDRVLQLRTPFGGGKTHSLLALYHLATSPEAASGVPELADLPRPEGVRVAVPCGRASDRATRPTAPR